MLLVDKWQNIVTQPIAAFCKSLLLRHLANSVAEDSAGGSNPDLADKLAKKIPAKGPFCGPKRVEKALEDGKFGENAQLLDTCFARRMGNLGRGYGLANWWVWAR